MDVNSFATLIGTVGFPIAMCIMIFYFLMQEQKMHKEEMNTLRDIIEKNTESIIELTDYLKQEGK